MKILVLQASAINLGFLGCYGCDWVATPNLDHLAAESVVFDQHFADDLSQEPGPMFGDLLSTRLPLGAWQSTGLSEGNLANLEDAFSKTADTLGQLAKRAGWLCWALLPSLQPPWLIDREFTDPYLRAGRAEEGPAEMPLALLAPETGDLTGLGELAWERLRCTYAGAVSFFDSMLGEFLETVGEFVDFDEVQIVFTSDRGLALGEHGVVGNCRPWLHEEVVHLPLLFRQPKGEGGGRRIFALTQPPDLAATVLELFGQGGGGPEGQSLVPLLQGHADGKREFCFLKWRLGEEEEWSLRTRDCALILPVKQLTPPARAMQFFLKPEDRWEVNNVVQHHQELVEQLEKSLRGQMAQKQ